MLTLSAVQISFDPGSPAHGGCCAKQPDPQFLSLLSRRILARAPEERIVPEKVAVDDGSPSPPPRPGGYLSIIDQRAFFSGFGGGLFRAAENDFSTPDELDLLDLFRIGQPADRAAEEDPLNGLLGMLFAVLDRLSDLTRDLYTPNAAALPQSSLAGAQAAPEPANDEVIETGTEAEPDAGSEETDAPPAATA